MSSHGATGVSCGGSVHNGKIGVGIIGVQLGRSFAAIGHILALQAEQLILSFIAEKILDVPRSY